MPRPVCWRPDASHSICSAWSWWRSLPRSVRLPPRLFLLPDALGLALFTVSGTQVALALGAPWLVVSLMGVITGVFGGILRDVLCNEEPLVFTGELYATASWCGALLLVGLHHLGYPASLAALAGGLLVLAIRLLAMRFGWNLPVFVSR